MEPMGTEKKVYNDPTADAVLRKIPAAGEIWTKKEYDGEERDFLVIAATMEVAHGAYVSDNVLKSAHSRDFTRKAGERCYYSPSGVLRVPTRFLTQKQEELSMETLENVRGQINAYMCLVPAGKEDASRESLDASEKDKTLIRQLKNEIAWFEQETKRQKDIAMAYKTQKEAYKELLVALVAPKRGSENDKCTV